MSDLVPITHRYFGIKGYVVSGYLMFAPVDESGDPVSWWSMIKIPDEDVISVYERLLLPQGEKPRVPAKKNTK